MRRDSMFCKNCGAEISDDSTFCSSCGSDLRDGKKIQTDISNARKGNWKFIILLGCFGLIAISLFLPWVGLDHEKLKQTAINEIGDEYGIVGEYLGNQYMDLAYEMTPLEKAKDISFFSYSSVVNSDYQGTTSPNYKCKKASPCSSYQQIYTPHFVILNFQQYLSLPL